MVCLIGDVNLAGESILIGDKGLFGDMVRFLIGVLPPLSSSSLSMSLGRFAGPGLSASSSSLSLSLACFLGVALATCVIFLGLNTRVASRSGAFKAGSGCSLTAVALAVLLVVFAVEAIVADDTGFLMGLARRPVGFNAFADAGLMADFATVGFRTGFGGGLFVVVALSRDLVAGGSFSFSSSEASLNATFLVRRAVGLGSGSFDR